MKNHHFPMGFRWFSCHFPRVVTMALIGISLAAAGGAHILRGLREAEHHHAHLDALAELREGEDGTVEELINYHLV